MFHCCLSLCGGSAVRKLLLLPRQNCQHGCFTAWEETLYPITSRGCRMLVSSSHAHQPGLRALEYQLCSDYFQGLPLLCSFTFPGHSRDPAVVLSGKDSATAIPTHRCRVGESRVSRYGHDSLSQICRGLVASRC